MSNVYAYRGRRRDPLARLYVPGLILLVLLVGPNLGDTPAPEEPAVRAKPAPYIRMQSRSDDVDRGGAETRATDSSPFDGCNEARAAGHEDIPEGSPLYGEHMDGDHDGVACERVKQPRR